MTRSDVETPGETLGPRPQGRIGVGAGPGGWGWGEEAEVPSSLPSPRPPQPRGSFPAPPAGREVPPRSPASLCQAPVRVRAGRAVQAPAQAWGALRVGTGDSSGYQGVARASASAGPWGWRRALEVAAGSEAEGSGAPGAACGTSSAEARAGQGRGLQGPWAEDKARSCVGESFKSVPSQLCPFLSIAICKR